MIALIYAMKDNKVGSFHPPMTMANDVLMQRSLIQALKNPEGQLCQFAQDFDLYHIGQYNDADASIDMLKTPRLVISMTQLKVPPLGPIQSTSNNPKKDNVS